MTGIRFTAGTAAIALAVTAANGFAQSDNLAAKFGAREGVRDIGISPEGKWEFFVAGD